MLLSTYTVGDTSDSPTDPQSLRYAIAQANTQGGGTISFSPTAFPAGSSETIDLTGSPLTIDAPATGSLVTIDGPGSSVLTISGQNTVGDFLVNSNAEVSGMTILNGHAYYGGGIANSAALTIDQVDVKDCSAYGITVLANLSPIHSPGVPEQSGQGGGIYNSGTLTVENSTIDANTASLNGGGIFNGGTLTVEQNSTINSNSADYKGGGICSFGASTVDASSISNNTAIYGGGVYNSQGSATITNSTISGNVAGEIGGGVYTAGSSNTIQDSTISGNRAQFGGGGVYSTVESLQIADSTISGNIAGSDEGGAGSGGGILDNAASSSITDSTIANNSAGYYGGGIASVDNLTLTDSTISGNIAASDEHAQNVSTAYGGGIYGQASLSGTIVAGNTCSLTDEEQDLAGTSFTGTNNLIGDGSGDLPQSDNILGTASSPVSADLAPLGFYGGPTETMPLIPGSQAIDAGMDCDDENGSLITTDQRGLPLDSGGTDMPDIGAYQSNPITVNTLAVDPVGPGLMTFSDATSLADAFGGDQTILIDPSLITVDDGSVSIGDIVSVS